MAHYPSRSIVPLLVFLVVGVVPLVLALVVFSHGLIAVDWMLALAGTSALTLLTGIGLLLAEGRKQLAGLQEQGNQARRLQEANLEIERLTYEYQHANRLRRDLERQREEQNQAVLQVAREFVNIAGTVQEKAEAADLDAVTRQQIRSLNTICHDQVELLNVEVAAPPEAAGFIADTDLYQLVVQLREQNRLPEDFTIQCEDTDISAMAPRAWFLNVAELALTGMTWFALDGPIQARMISYLHADLGNVLQLVIRSQGFGISASEGHNWFRQFEMHLDGSGRYLGPGLRMMLIKRYAEKMGGLTHLATEEQNALTLTLTLPLRPDDIIDDPVTA